MTTKQPYPEEFKIEAVRPLGVTEADCLKRRCPALFKLGIKRNWVNQSVDKSQLQQATIYRHILRLVSSGSACLA